MNNSTTSINENLSKAGKEVKDAKDYAENAAKGAANELANRSQQMYRDAKEIVTETAEEWKGKSIKSANQIRSKIRSKPMSYLAGAAVAGALLGWVFTRGGRKVAAT